MKKQHLTNEQVLLLGNYNLTGSALFEALEHIEGCEICRLKVPTASSETIFKRLSETELPPETAVLTDSKRAFPFGWAWGIGFAACVIGLSVGLYYFVVNSPKNELAANKNTVNQPSDANSQNKNATQNTEPEKEEKAEINNQTLPENQVIGKSKNTNATIEIAKNKTPEIIQLKPNVNVDKNEIAETTAAPKNGKPFDERSGLEKFLVKIPATIVNLRPNFGNVRGGNTDDSQLILSPNGEVIRETEPNLSWNKLKDATAYQVSVTDKNYKEAVNEKTVENTFKVKTPLKRGQTYIFTVTAEKENNEEDSKPNKPALFKVAGEKVIKDLERAERTGKDWKILSVTLNEGMLSESEKTLNNILSKNPKDKLAARLLKRVKLLLDSAKTAD
jgi:hypothetical protein